jgi:hypothetical protein
VVVRAGRAHSIRISSTSTEDRLDGEQVVPVVLLRADGMDLDLQRPLLVVGCGSAQPRDSIGGTNPPGTPSGAWMLESPGQGVVHDVRPMAGRCHGSALHRRAGEGHLRAST